MLIWTNASRVHAGTTMRVLTVTIRTSACVPMALRGKTVLQTLMSVFRTRAVIASVSMLQTRIRASAMTAGKELLAT